MSLIYCSKQGKRIYKCLSTNSTILGLYTEMPFSEMTHNMSSGTLNHNQLYRNVTSKTDCRLSQTDGDTLLLVKILTD